MGRLGNYSITDLELKHHAKVILSKHGELRVKDISSKILEEYGVDVTPARITHTIHAEPTITRRPIRVPRIAGTKNSGTHLAYLYGVTSTTGDLVEVSITFMVPSLNVGSNTVDLCNRLLEAGFKDFRVE